LIKGAAENDGQIHRQLDFAASTAVRQYGSLPMTKKSQNPDWQIAVLPYWLQRALFIN